MKLWTYQPQGFRVDNPQARANPKLGYFWKTLRSYRKALPRLYRELGITRGPWPIWCHTVHDDSPENPWMNSEDPSVKWELEVPDPQIVAFISEGIWHPIVMGGDDGDVKKAIVPRPTEPDLWISAVVRFPLSAECKAIRKSPLA